MQTYSSCKYNNSTTLLPTNGTKPIKGILILHNLCIISVNIHDKFQQGSENRSDQFHIEQGDYTCLIFNVYLVTV